MPSGCAALYRHAMFDEVGLFDDDFFAYAERTGAVRFGPGAMFVVGEKG